MKLHILSDLHIDSYLKQGLPAGSIPETESDIVVLAGDISDSNQGIHWAIKQSKHLGKPIIYVAGNHEYFGEDLLSYDDACFELSQGTNVVFLQKTSWQMNHIRLLGCTLWTDFAFGTNAHHHAHAEHALYDKWQCTSDILDYATGYMHDYQRIRHGGQLAIAKDILSIHETQKAWLYNELRCAQKDGVSAVVISHHGVSAKSIAKKYAMSPSNGCFVSDFSDWMHSDFAPKLWIHGHTHDAFDYQLGKTRVIANPRAYPSETSSTQLAFDWHKIVDLSMESL